MLIPCAVLTEIHRNAGQIVRACAAIKASPRSQRRTWARSRNRCGDNLVKTKRPADALNRKARGKRRNARVTASAPGIAIDIRRRLLIPRFVMIDAATVVRLLRGETVCIEASNVALMPTPDVPKLVDVSRAMRRAAKGK